MFRKAALRPGTVISYGILACCICYFVITTPARVSIGAAAVKILVPDNSLAAGQAFEAIAILAWASSQLLPALSQRSSVVSSDPESHAGSLGREPLKQ